MKVFNQQSPKAKLGIILHLFGAIFFALWGMGISFTGLISGIFWLLYAILLFQAPNEVAYRTFLFAGEHFNSFFQYAQRCLAVTYIISAFVIMMFPPSDFSVGLLGITFGGSHFWLALGWLREAIRLQRQGLFIASTQKGAAWFVLIGSASFIVAGLALIAFAIVEKFTCDGLLVMP